MMEWYYKFLIIILVIIFVLILLWLIIGLYVYNYVLVCKKTIDIKDITEDSHWYVFKKELLKRQELYYEYEKNAKEVEITNERNLKLKGWLIRQDKKEVPTLVIFAHGYRSMHQVDINLVDNWMLKAGYDCLLIDQEGLGKSEGKRMGFGIYDSENILKWVEYINNIYNHKVNIILNGISMGANTMLLDANKKIENVKCIISDCAYTSMYDQFKYMLKGNRYIMFNIRTFLKLVWKRNIKISTLDTVKESLYPILFIHGKSDKFVPTDFTYQNYENCTNIKDILIVDGALHGESSLLNPNEYNKKIKEFISKVL